MRRTATLIVLVCFAMASTLLWAGTRAAHPACFDFNGSSFKQNGLLAKPLALTNCPQAIDAPKPEVEEGFLTHYRGVDEAGMSLGFVGYQRINGAKQEALFVLRTNNGGNASFIELLVGQIVTEKNKAELKNARVYGIPSECRSLTNAWREPNGSIRIALNLTLTDVMRALVAPNGELPSTLRDDRILKSIFAERMETTLPSEQGWCIATAEYELRADQLSWQIHSLRFDIENDSDHDAYSALMHLVPRLQMSDVAIFLRSELEQVRKGLLSPFAQANNACDKVLERAAHEQKPEAALSVLGACLAGSAPSKVHQQVALEMADISLRTGDTEAALRYLDILRMMLEDA